MIDELNNMYNTSRIQEVVIFQAPTKVSTIKVCSETKI